MIFMADAIQRTGWIEEFSSASFFVTNVALNHSRLTTLAVTKHFNHDNNVPVSLWPDTSIMIT
jgi:hypothetical protein